MPIRVLIVEDDESIREALSEFMIDEGYQAFAAKDGLHAIDVLRNGTFDPTLILLDLHMPRLSGAEFLQERQRLGLVPNARVLMLSATAEKPEVPGVTAWIRKPVELETLQEAIELHGDLTA